MSASFTGLLICNLETVSGLCRIELDSPERFRNAYRLVQAMPQAARAILAL